MKRLIGLGVLAVVAICIVLAPADLLAAKGDFGSAEQLGLPRLEEGNVAKRVADTLIFVAGVLSVIFLIIGGIRYASSNGSPAQIEAAKKTVTYSIAGLIIAILASAIVGFVLGRSPQ